MKKILTVGVFDYLHLGHLRLFKNCKKHGDYLIVAVQDGGHVLKYKPDARVLYSTEERVEMVEAMRIVDEVVVYQSACPEFLATMDFDVLILGEDQTADRFVKCETWCNQNGKEVVHLKRTPGICSSDIKKNR